MTENLNRLAYFVAIVETGTITAAANRLGVSKAVVSKQLQLLEQDLGVTLLLRSSRKMNLTDLGSEFYEGARASVALAQETYQGIRQRDGELSGSLRISAPVDFGNLYIAPFAAQFMIANPTVKVDLRFSDTLVNPIEEKFDIAYRIGWPEDSSNIARKLTDFKLYVVASPGLLERLGPPQNLDELQTLPFIGHATLKKPEKWTCIDKKDRSRSVLTFNQVATADTKQTVLSLTLDGAGLAIMPDFLIRPELTSGMLIDAMPQCDFPSGGIYTIFPPAPYRSNATKAFSEAFHDHFKRHMPDTNTLSG